MRSVKVTLLSLILVSTAVFFACDKEDDSGDNNDQQQKSWQLLIYGRSTCGYCKSFKNDCEDEGLDYTFYDIDSSSTKNREMWDKLNEANMGGGSVSLPVVDAMVEGESHMFIRPDIQTVIDTLPIEG